MTVHKPRRPRTFAHAMTKIMAAFTAEGAAHIIERTHSSVYAFADPDQDVWPNVRQTVLLDAAYVNDGHGEPPLLTVLQQEHLRLTVTAPEHVAGDPLERVTETIREVAEAADAYRACHNPGPISPLQATEALREIEEAIEALQNMAKDVEARSKVVPLGQGSAAG